MRNGKQTPEGLLDVLRKVFERVPYTINRDRLDDLILSKHKDKLSEKAKELVGESDEGLVQFPYLLQDTFTLFYKPNPQFLPDEQIAPEFIVNKTVLEKLTNTETYSEMKNVTTLDDVNSAIATLVLAEKLFEELKDTLREIKKKTDQIEKLKQQLTELGKEGKNGKLLEKAEKIADKIDKLAGEMAGMVTQAAVSIAARNAKEEFDEIRALMASLNYGTQPGQPVRVDPSEAIELAHLLKSNSRVREIARMLGRARNLLKHTIKTKFKKTPVELHSITTGDRLERLLSSEIVKLKVAPLAFYKDFYEKKLLHYELKTRQKEEKGPFVICLDLSSSMKGLKEQWCKGLALATIDLAIREKRHWALIAFDWRIKYSVVFKSPPTPKELLEIFSIGASGGTNFEKPLSEAMDVIKSEKDFNKADILFISDGESKVSPSFLEEFNEFRKKHNVHVLGVLIDGHPRVMTQFCDEVLALYGNLSDETASIIFEKLTSSR